MASKVRFGQPFSMRKRSHASPTLVGHVLLAKKYPEDRYWTYYVRLEGTSVCWTLRMSDRGQTLLGMFVEFQDVRVDAPSMGFAGQARVIGQSVIDENVSRVVRNANATSSPRPLPTQVRRVWLIGGNGEARGDLEARAPGAKITPVKASLLSAKELKRALLKTIERKDLDADHDVILLARGGGTEVILLDSEEVARALAQASRRVATILAVGHARDELRIAGLLVPQLVRTTPTDAAALFAQPVASVIPPPRSPDARDTVQAPAVVPSATGDLEGFIPPSPQPMPSVSIQPMSSLVRRPGLYLAMAVLSVSATIGLWLLLQEPVEPPSVVTPTPMPKVQAATHAPAALEPATMQPAATKLSHGQTAPPQSKKPRRKKRSPTMPTTVELADGESEPKLQPQPAPSDERRIAPAPGSYYPSPSPLLGRPDAVGRSDGTKHTGVSPQ